MLLEKVFFLELYHKVKNYLGSGHSNVSSRKNSKNGPIEMSSSSSLDPLKLKLSYSDYHKAKIVNSRLSFN